MLTEFQDMFIKVTCGIISQVAFVFPIEAELATPRGCLLWKSATEMRESCMVDDVM